MDVVGGLEFGQRCFACGSQRLVGDPARQCRGQVDDGRDVADRQVARAGLDHRVAIPADDGRDAAHRVVAVPAGDLLEADAGVGRKGREVRRHRDLVVLDRRLQRAEEEVVGVDGAGAAYRGHVDRAPQQLEDDGHLGRCVGVDERADRRPAVADRRMRHVGQGEREQGLHPPGVGIREHSRMTRERPDPDPSVVDGDLVQPGQPVDVDEQGRRRQPHGQQRHQALAAGQHLGVRLAGQGRQGVLEIGWSTIREGGWLHARLALVETRRTVVAVLDSGPDPARRVVRRDCLAR